MGEDDIILFQPDHGQLTTYELANSVKEREDCRRPHPSCIQVMEACSLLGVVVLATIVSTGEAETLIMPHICVFLLLCGSDVYSLLPLDF